MLAFFLHFLYNKFKNVSALLGETSAFSQKYTPLFRGDKSGGFMSLTIYDISKKANVSIATVSRVLNGNSNVRESTRKKVMDVIEKYDYTPNAFARGMSLRSIHTIGILCADSSDMFLAKAVYLLEQELQANGYEALLCCTGYNLDIRKNYINLILSKKIDALILVGSSFISTNPDDNQYLVDFAKEIPIMVLNASFNYANVYSTLCDDYTTMYETTTELLESGITDILYLYNSNTFSGSKKLNGFIDAMEDKHIAGFRDLIHYYDRANQMDDIANFVESLSKTYSFHAVMTSDDYLAIGAVKYAKRNNLRLPEDLSVIGYNNSLLCDCCTPELSSIDNQLEPQTHQLIKTLLGVLNGDEVPQECIFSGKLIRRGTTKL